MEKEDAKIKVGKDIRTNRGGKTGRDEVKREKWIDKKGEGKILKNKEKERTQEENMER